jgi:hypothetical protein
MPRAKSIGRKLRANEFYCVSCRKAVACHPEDIGVKVYRNKKTGTSPAIVSQCGCGTNLTKFIAKDKLADAKADYGMAR